MFCVCVSIVERVRVSPKARASEGAPAVEQRTSRGPAVQQIWQQEALSLPGIAVEGDWYILLDVAPKKAGTLTPRSSCP